MQAAIVDAIAPSCTLRSNALVFWMCSRGSDLDPVVEILVRRVILIRRMKCKWPRVEQSIQRIHVAYAKIGLQGTDATIQGISLLLPSPPPADDNGTSWKPAVPPRGPIGHLINCIFRMGAAIASNMDIVRHKEEMFSIHSIPWQHVRMLTRDLGIRARTRAASKARTYLANCTEVDFDIYKESIRGRSAEAAKIIEWVTTLSAWSQEKKEMIGQAMSITSI